jgi:hypothetical protein
MAEFSLLNVNVAQLAHADVVFEFHETGDVIAQANVQSFSLRSPEDAVMNYVILGVKAVLVVGD